MSDFRPLSVRIQLPLDRFDLDIEFETTHRVTGIFGVSGSGKTTMLETIAGLRRRAAGRIALGDEVWADADSKLWLPPEERGIGYVPQDSLLFPNQSVLGNLSSGRKRAARRGVDFDRTLENVTRVLAIDPLLDRDVNTLSGGERQRVALGRALCSGPSMLLLDEPLASLDIGLRRKVLPFLYRVQSEFDLPILLVSHNPVEVQALCDDLIVLREGKIIARGEPRTVLTRPDVFPIAEHEGYENILPGTVLERQQGTNRIGLGRGAETPVLIVPETMLEPGSPLLVSVPANEIMIALQRPVGLSARNIIPARVESIQDVEGLRLIASTIAPGLPPVVAEITADALEELRVEPGTELFLIVKTSAITLYEEGGGANR